MEFVYKYKPVQYFLITLCLTWVFGFIAANFSHQRGKESWLMVFLFAGMLVPGAVALAMIFSSASSSLIGSFWERLFLIKISSATFLLILAIPAVFLLATSVSLLFGKSADQFALASEFNVMKGWQFLSLAIPLLLAPALEELGWRGYGIDSLRAHYHLLSTSLIFAFLWGIWHLPLFFIKGYYQYELVHTSWVYVANFFISIIPVAIITNWIYFKNGRSILIIIIVHGLLNACAILFKTEQFTKCIVTLLLSALAAFLVIYDNDFFLGAP